MHRRVHPCDVKVLPISWLMLEKCTTGWVHLLNVKALIVSLLTVDGCTSRCTSLRSVHCVTISYELRGARREERWKGGRKELYL